MPRLYTYIVTVDTGLAPNPFWGWCTLAVCTPNHQGAAIEPGDWIAGFSPKTSGHQFIYAMQVDERIHMDDYFNDPRFQSKKPEMQGSWRQRCGDNFYHQSDSGEWIQEPNPFHVGLLEVDVRRPYVFIGRNFWYLGSARESTPSEFRSLIGGRGIRVNHPKKLVQSFISWVKASFKNGITAPPLNLESGFCTTLEQPEKFGCTSIYKQV